MKTDIAKYYRAEALEFYKQNSNEPPRLEESKDSSSQRHLILFTFFFFTLCIVIAIKIPFPEKLVKNCEGNSFYLKKNIDEKEVFIKLNGGFKRFIKKSDGSYVSYSETETVFECDVLKPEELEVIFI